MIIEGTSQIYVVSTSLESKKIYIRIFRSSWTKRRSRNWSKIVLCL